LIDTYEISGSEAQQDLPYEVLRTDRRGKFYHSR